MSDSPKQALARPSSVEEAFRQFAPRVYHLARRILGNEADAQDVTQDVMLQLLRKLDSFRGDSSFPTWLHRVTVNAALAHRRRAANRHEQPSGDNADRLPPDYVPARQPRPWPIEPDRPVLDNERQAQIESAIAELPDSYREVYVLADVEQMSNADIAELLGLNLPAVKSRLHRARLLMRDRLAPYFEESRT